MLEDTNSLDGAQIMTALISNNKLLFFEIIHPRYIDIITIETWYGGLYHVEWISSYHKISRDAKRRVWPDDVSSSTRRDTIRQIKLLM